MKALPFELTHAELTRVLAYDPATGVFTWKADRKFARNDQQSGFVAGGEDGAGYRRITMRGRRYRSHRLAWFYVYGAWPSGHLDHRDNDRGNDRIANLREASRAVNAQNQRKPHANNTSGFLGVHWNNGKFAARVSLNGKRYIAGYFNDPAIAHAAYLSLKAKLHEGFVSG